jgi:hypothetical protein
MTRLANDFAEIRARRDELARERDAALNAAPADDDPEIECPVVGDDLVRALFGDPVKAHAHAEALSPGDDPRIAWTALAFAIRCGRCIELTPTEQGWTATDPRSGCARDFDNLDAALAVVTQACARNPR